MLEPVLLLVPPAAVEEGKACPVRQEDPVEAATSTIQEAASASGASSEALLH